MVDEPRETTEAAAWDAFRRNLEDAIAESEATYEVLASLPIPTD